MLAEGQRHPIGSQPIAPGPGGKPAAFDAAFVLDLGGGAQGIAIVVVKGRSDLAVMWLELGWGRYVVVHPAGDTDLADACARYRALLVDQTTFSSVTVEELLDAGALPTSTAAALRDRYLPGW